MTMPTVLPYGLRDVKITPYTVGETLGTTPIDLPNSRTFSFAEAEDFDELRGDDGVVTIRGKGPGVNWALEGGGVSFEVVQAMYGGTLTSSGTTPAQTKTFRKNQNDVRPYFKVEGQVISDSGGDYHAILYKCRATDDFNGDMGDSTFLLYGAGGRAIGRQTSITGPPEVPIGTIYDLVQNETAVDIDS
jgi:hypothetical protein